MTLEKPGKLREFFSYFVATVYGLFVHVCVFWLNSLTDYIGFLL